MKASKLIEELQKIVKEKGDISVLIEERGFGGYAIHSINDIVVSTISPSYIEEGLSDSLWEELFPELDKSEYNDDTDGPEKEYIEISLSEMIYST